MPWEKLYHAPKNQRLPQALYARTDLITFITLRAYDQQSPFIKPAINQMVIRALAVEQVRLKCKVFTYCLMPDHLHFLVRPTEEGYSVIEFTNQFKGKATNQSWSLGWEGKLWQPRFFDHIVRKDEDLRKIAKYILDNPVRKSLCDEPVDWEWSGHLNELPL